MAKEAQRNVKGRRHRRSEREGSSPLFVDAFARAQFVLIRQDHAVALGKAGDDLRKIERAITDLDRAGLNDAAFYDERLIDDQRAGRRTRTFSRVPVMMFISPVMPAIRFSGGFSRSRTMV